MVGMGTRQEMKEGEEGLHLGTERERLGRDPLPAQGEGSRYWGERER